MKKIILVAMMAVLAVSAKAQFEAGTRYVGASFSNMGLSYSTSERFRMGLNAQVGYFMADQFMLRGDVGYNHTRSTDDLSLGVMGSYYFIENGVHLGAGASYDLYSTRNDNTKARHYVSIPVEAGYTFYLNGNIAIEPAVYYKMSLKDFSERSSFGFKLGLGIYF